MFNNTISSKAILDQMALVLTWLDGLGLPSYNSRYARYEEIVDAFFMGARPESNMDDAQRRYDEMTKAFRECLDIIIVFNNFKDNIEPRLAKTLKQVVSGQDVPQLDVAGASRNYLFELLVAARFSAAGYNIQFDSAIDDEAETDVVAKRDGYVVYSECKRLSSEKKLEAKIKEAAKQLIRKIVNSSDDFFGLIFIDISSCIISELPPKPVSQIRARRIVDRVVKSFIARNGNLINSLNIRFKEISLGVCFVANVPIWAPNSILYTIAPMDVRAASTLSDKKYAQLEMVLKGFDGALSNQLSTLS